MTDDTSKPYIIGVLTKDEQAMAALVERLKEMEIPVFLSKIGSEQDYAQFTLDVQSVLEEKKKQTDLDPYRNAIRMAEAIVGNDPDALLRLGMSLLSDVNDSDTLAKGLSCIEIAAKAEHPEAMHLYASFIAEGLIRGQDLDDALVWALKALKFGFPDDGLLDMIQEKKRNED